MLNNLPLLKQENTTMFKSGEISDQEFLSLTKAVKKKYGIDFTNYESRSLKRGFARLISKHQLNSVLDLWSRIMTDKQFFISCIDDLTVNLTELFRNPEVWSFIKYDVFEELSSKDCLDIWHAGCSSGEEVYTMSIILKERDLLANSKILATDLSQSVLQKAKIGAYPNFLMNRYSKSYNQYKKGGNLYDYFEIGETHSQVIDELKKQIKFEKHNLIHDKIEKSYDIIFCRNVMIYFDDMLKKQIIKNFFDQLNTGGFFVIGYYDMIPKESRDLFELYDARTRVYRKL